MKASLQLVQPAGQAVHEEAPAAEKLPEVQAAQAADPPAENWLAAHWVQEPANSPKPASQALQVEASEQLVHPVGQDEHEEAPAAEKAPKAQAAQAADPPAEN